MTYNVFVRNWWKNNPSWPNGLEPHAGRKTYLYRNVATEEEARSIATVYNNCHKAGRLSRKAEYEEN